MLQRVFFAVLNMGLGHATRSLPLIREFRQRNWQVLIGSSGRARDFLLAEVPNASHIETPDYQIRYSASRLGLLPTLARQIPYIYRQIQAENRLCAQVVRDFEPHLIVSDHCYGMYHRACPSIFLSHQIYFAVPAGLTVFRSLPASLNRFYHRRFSGVVIPDISAGPAGGILSGQLSKLPANHTTYRYCGPLASVRRLALKTDIDLLVSISGPEPQRSILETRILADIRNIPGKKVVTLGKSESQQQVIEEDNLRIYPHLPRSEMENYLNRARLVVSRPGYSTLMELAELGKKALLIPTPGQTEQEYLARNLSERKLFYAVAQNQLNLRQDVPKALEYSGYQEGFSSADSVKSFFTVVSELLSRKPAALNK